MPIKPSVAVIDDDEAVRDAVIGLLRSHDLVAKAFASAEEFLNSTRLRLTTCLIADVRMKGMSGLELFGHLAALGLAIPTILVTAYPDESLRSRALNAGVTAWLVKPFGEDELLDSIKRTVGRSVLYSPLKR